MLRKIWLLLVALVLTASVANASPFLYVDSAPNVYGSPNWAPWWAATKTDVIAGSFTNLRTATHPGTNYISPYDEIVYSTMDLGKRLHWVYWLPGETIASLAGRFEVKWVIDWGGVDYTYDGGAWANDAPGVGWSTPGSWEEQGGGVIGSLGFAWWSTDNDAPPMDTNGNPYDETNQADVDALATQVLQYQTYARGMVRLRDDPMSSWNETALTVNMVPEPTSILLLAIGVGAIGFGLRRKRTL